MFALGHREMWHCFDLAIQKLHQGDVAHLDCPSYYVWGTAFTWAPIGGEMIPLGSDVDFTVEVLECNRTPEFTKYFEQPVTTSMQKDQCFYLHSVASEGGQDVPLVLTCENDSEADPALPCYLEEWVKDNKHQQFHFDEATG